MKLQVQLLFVNLRNANNVIAIINALDKVVHNNISMKLVATNAPVPFEITITKDEFTLGRKQGLVDG